MKKLVLISLVMIASLILVGCGNQKAFAGQASGVSGFQCSEGEDCGFVTDMWVVGKIRNALSDYVDQQGLSNALSGYVQTGDLRANYWDAYTVQLQIDMLRRNIRSVPGNCVTVSLDDYPRPLYGTGDSFCQNYLGYFHGVRNMSHPICVTVEHEINQTYFDSSSRQCDGSVQLEESVTRLSSCEQIASPVVRTYCTTLRGAEPKLGDVKFAEVDRSITCCRIGS